MNYLLADSVELKVVGPNTRPLQFANDGNPIPTRTFSFVAPVVLATAGDLLQVASIEIGNISYESTQAAGRDSAGGNWWDGVRTTLGDSSITFRDERVEKLTSTRRGVGQASGRIREVNGTLSVSDSMCNRLYTEFEVTISGKAYLVYVEASTQVLLGVQNSIGSFKIVSK